MLHNNLPNSILCNLVDQLLFRTHRPSSLFFSPLDSVCSKDVEIPSPKDSSSLSLFPFIYPVERGAVTPSLILKISGTKVFTVRVKTFRPVIVPGIIVDQFSLDTILQVNVSNKESFLPPAHWTSQDHGVGTDDA